MESDATATRELRRKEKRRKGKVQLLDAREVWTAGGSEDSRRSLGDKRRHMPVPPQEEQHAVVAHITRETAKLDAVRAATERTIALLKERRAALIAAAVTGQLDVGAEA